MRRKMGRLYCAMILASIFVTACGGGSGAEDIAQSGNMANSASQDNRTTALLSSSVVADYTPVVQQLYVAYFGRPADPRGLENFGAALAAANAPTDARGLAAAYGVDARVRNLIDALGTSSESVALYGASDTSSTLSFVNAIFQNILNRNPNMAGLLFWSEAIDAGNLTRGNAALSIMAGALANTTPLGLIDAALIEKKIYTASAFTGLLNTDAQIDAYSGSEAATTARDLLKFVTSTSEPDVLQAQIEAALLEIRGIPFESIVYGNTSAGVQRFVAINDEVAWEELWSAHAQASQLPRPAINFNERTVIVVMPGIYYQVGDTIKIRRIYQRGETNIVEYRHSPIDCMVNGCVASMSQLAHIVSVPRSQYPFTFVKQN